MNDPVMNVIARKIWILGDSDGSSQDIDHVWTGKPGVAAYISDPSHYAKISVNGQNCETIAGRIVDLLNAEGITATSPKDDADRALILVTMRNPDMGSMALAGLYHVLALDYGSAGFQQSLNAASRTQLDVLLEKCRHYLRPDKA